jgi:hypothetical protein
VSDAAAKHYVVFNCQACGARIFAEASQLGRAGVCPSCKQLTGVLPKDPKQRVSGPVSQSDTTVTRGGATTAARLPSGRTSASDRRKARRIPLADAKVGVESKGAGGRPPSPAELSELLDISEGGIGYLVVGERDRKRLTGFAPPPIRVGDTITVTLHVPSLFRPRTVKAVVRRIDSHASRKELFRIGAEFTGLGEEARGDIRKLVDRRPDSRG